MSAHGCPGTCGKCDAERRQQEEIARLRARIAELERHLSPPLDEDESNGARLVKGMR